MEKKESLTLKDLKINEHAKILSVGGQGALRQHFLDMGVIPGAELTVVKFAPLGDPMELQIHGYELSLRLEDAEKIAIEKIPERKNKHTRIEKLSDSEHPGLGEEGRFHDKKSEDPLPEGEMLSFALVGNQNSGKTTLFNQLTGSNQHVGNFPGVTVDRKDGAIKGSPNTCITDLPGIYSMSPYTNEEIVSRNFVLHEKPKAIINIVDATNIERNLYLSIQLLEMNKPMVIALNMMDEFTGNHGSIDLNGLEERLGVPVIPISAIKNEGVDELVSHALHIAKYQEKPKVQDFCSKEDHDGAVHRAIHAVENLIEDHAQRADLPLRFAATKVIENDSLIYEQLDLDQNEIEAIDHVILQMEKESGMDRSAAMADMRFDFIERVCEATIVRPKESKERIRSEKIDNVLTGKWTAIPCFILVMSLVFLLTFNLIGPFFQEILEGWIAQLGDALLELLTRMQVNDMLLSFVSKGLIEGVGSVLSFFPIVVTLFFFLSIMEDSGYIARVAFFMDKLLRKIGLSGRSIVPMLIGFGCTVPAVMATRTLPSKRDRYMTILLTPFMSCSAKLPIYGYFANAFFPGKAGYIMVGLYLLGIIVAILMALIMKNSIFSGKAVPFVMELPNYRMPGVKNVAQLLWDKSKDFITRAFSVILVSTIVVWFLQQFDIGLNAVESPSDSIMAMIAGLLVPLFKPLGLGDWRIVTSLVSGFMAKESVVATLEVSFGSKIHEVFDAVSAMTILVFSLLYTPCVAAIAAMKRELGNKWAIGIVFWQCLVAYIFAFIARFIMLAIGS
ncbi:MAG: ferrous iron transport protein B [Erysipelotrichaceae bacterium]|nr:ferrous iron transport protein B [Erysipelotrichaceae bacterium]